MTSTDRAILFAGLMAAAVATRAEAQSPAVGLGGYGGSMTGMEAGGPSIPYAGRFGGFMPYRMGTGGGGGLAFPTRAASTPSVTGRTPFGLAPMSGGMGRGLGPGSRMTPVRGMGVMPPSFGYPFRQPPSLLSPASSGSGMSM